MAAISAAADSPVCRWAAPPGKAIVRMGERDDLFRDLCELAPDLIFCARPDGALEYVNPAWLEALGYRTEDLDGVRHLEIVDAPEREAYEEILSVVLGGESRPRMQTRFLTRNGATFPVEGSLLYRTDATGEALVCGIFRDITARRRAQAQIDRLFALSLDLLCIASGDGFFRRVNPAFERTLGYSREELLSRSFVEFVHPDDRAATEAAVEQLTAGEPVVDFRNRYRAKDGSFRWLQWRSTPVDEAGLVYAVARDVTDERRQQELIERQARELARSNQDLEEFAYAASHDLQAPLRSIDTLVGFLRQDIDEPTPEVGEHLDRLTVRVRQMRELVEDLLTYSRAGRRPGEVAAVELGELVAEITRLLEIPEGFQVEVEGGEQVLETAVVPLEQVLRNLIANAIKHHDRSEGSVRISVQPEGAWWILEVSDDGPGIPPEHRERVFQMFQRLEQGDSGGSGIGLALVKKVVERFGGEVRVEGTAGRGTTIGFTWPRTMPDMEAE